VYIHGSYRKIKTCLSLFWTTLYSWSPMKSMLHGPNIVLKFHFNRVTTFRDMTIWKCCKFGLKRLFPPPNLHFGVLPLNIIFRHFLGRNRVIWAIKRRDRSSGVTGTDGKEYKKRENQMRWPQRRRQRGGGQGAWPPLGKFWPPFCEFIISKE